MQPYQAGPGPLSEQPPGSAAVAILGERSHDSLAVIGSGVLVHPKWVLTASHVIDGTATARAFDVFSPFGGFKRVERWNPKWWNPYEGTWYEDLGLLELESPYEICSPAPVAFEAGFEGPVLISGFGSRRAGLHRTRCAKASVEDSALRLDLASGELLGPGDSGAGVLAKGGTVVGIYYGLAPEGGPAASLLAPKREALTELLGGQSEAPGGTVVLSEEGVLGNGETRSFDLPHLRTENLVTVSVAAAGLSPNSEYARRVRLRTRVFGARRSRRVILRNFDSPFHTVRCWRGCAEGLGGEIAVGGDAARYQLRISEAVSRGG